MTESAGERPGQTDRGHPASNAPKSSHGALIAVIVLLVVVAVVVAGVVPRLRAKAALKVETDKLAVPSVEVLQPKRGSPQQELVLPGNMQAFIDAPIYARTNGYLQSWYFDIGAHVRKGQLLAEIEFEVGQRNLTPFS